MNRRRVFLFSTAFLVLTASVFWVAAYAVALPKHSVVGDPPAELHVMAVQFQGMEGATLRGWYIHADSAKGAVVLIHGIHSDRRQMLARARFLYAAGFSACSTICEPTAKAPETQLRSDIWKATMHATPSSFCGRGNPPAQSR